MHGSCTGSWHHNSNINTSLTVVTRNAWPLIYSRALCCHFSIFSMNKTCLFLLQWGRIWLVYRWVIGITDSNQNFWLRTLIRVFNVASPNRSKRFLAPRLIFASLHSCAVEKCLYYSTFFLRCGHVPTVWKSWSLWCSLSSRYWSILPITPHYIAHIGQCTVNIVAP